LIFVSSEIKQYFYWNNECVKEIQALKISIITIIEGSVMENEILKIAKRIRAISQTGIHFTKDHFDKDRFEELRGLSNKLVEQVADAQIDKIQGLFSGEQGFQTPKIDVRAVVVKEGQVLLTRECMDNRWSLPGGYADINYSPGEVAVKEVFEETGLEVKARRTIGIFDTNKHGFPPLEFHFYKIVILCELIGGSLRGSNETLESGFFSIKHLPELSLKRNTNDFMEIIFKNLDSAEAYFD
jgi:ADP-ribose pyrophosphatase YjhB (NUDIX family)